MPLYQYQCYACGLQFEAIAVANEARKSKKCTSCGELAKRRVTSTSFAFTKQVKGPTPTNTGVSAIDHDFDRVIAEDAKEKWGLIVQRQNRKRELLANNPGVTGHDLQKTAEGDYRVMSKKERHHVEVQRETFKDLGGVGGKPQE